MTSQPFLPGDLSDRDLLLELERATSCERHATARLIALLMEVDARRLYAGQGYSSLFTYCVQRLHLSEHAAYLRIEAARSARRFPTILERLADGSLHLTAVGLLGPHLTVTNHIELLDAAMHKSKRDVEQSLARLRPQPDVPATVRKLPASECLPAAPLIADVASVAEPAMVGGPSRRAVLSAPGCPAIIKPLAPERYKLQFTVSRETHDKLRRVQDLMRHGISDGDLSAIFDRALTVLLSDLSKRKCAATERPQLGRTARPRSRHIPAAVRRDVWTRDGGQCAFRGEHGRCTETGFLEFHHVVPYADGGATSVSNIQLRCRTHNQYEADRWSGELRTQHVRETRELFGA